MKKEVLHPRLVSLATPLLYSPFVLVKSLGAPLTSKWLAVDLQSRLRFRDGFLDLPIWLFWLPSEDLFQTGTGRLSFYKFLLTGTFILLHLLLSECSRVVSIYTDVEPDLISFTA